MWLKLLLCWELLLCLPLLAPTEALESAGAAAVDSLPTKTSAVDSAAGDESVEHASKRLLIAAEMEEMHQFWCTRPANASLDSRLSTLDSRQAASLLCSEYRESVRGGGDAAREQVSPAKKEEVGQMHDAFCAVEEHKLKCVALYF